VVSFEQLRSSTACERSSVEESGSHCCITGTMCLKSCRRQLLKECWSVWESRTTFKVNMLWLWKRKKGHNHETFTTKVVKSVFILLVTRGYDVLYSDWEEKILRRSVHHVELTFMYSAQKHTLLSYRKLSFQLLLINFPEFNFALLSYENILTTKFPQITVLILPSA